MKKLVLLVLLSISLVANAQKGISYQAVILDPAKIEIPGSDISGQPLVNGDVWVKFAILSGTNLQFEEIQQTKTDAYGLVNLTIGSVASTAFNSVTWDANQKSLQVFVSFDNGSSYTKVSDQKLTYSPYALFAETAGKLGSTLGIAGGGTGATTAVGARANLGLGNVDNTADASKPISAATQTALDLKANVADVNAALDLKASAAMLAAHMAITVDTSMLATKAALTDLNDYAPINTPSFTGIPTAPTASPRTNSTQIATTAYTDAAVAVAVASSGVADNSVTTAKIANGAVTDAKITSVSGSKIVGVIPVNNGGTGQTTVAGVLSILGLATNNIAIGSQAGTPNQGVNANTIAIGGGAGRGNQGQSSIAIGYVSGDQNQGANSISIGGNAAQSGQGTQSIAIGFAAGQNGQGANAVAIGTFAGQSGQVANSIAINAAGTSSPLNPTNAGFYVNPVRTTTATSSLLYYNTATKEITTAAGSFVDLTTNQTIAGVKTFSSNISVNGLTIGRGNGNNDESVAIGQGAMRSSNVNGKRNTAVGTGAMGQYVGTAWDNNTSIGYNNMPRLTTGSGNTSVGGESLFMVTTGTQNTSIGNQSLINTTGNDNVGVGKRSGQTITSGHQNTIIGTDADVSTATFNNSTAIGYGAIVSASNAIQLGNNSVTNVKTNGSITAGAGASSIAGSLVVGATSATGSSAALEVKSTTQGLLLPRLTMTQRNAIPNPTQGLMIFCTTAGPNGQLQVYNGSAWTNFIGETAFKSGKLYNYRSSVLYSFDGSTWANTGIGVPNNGFNGASGSRSYIGTIGSKTYHHDPYTQTSYSFNGTAWTTESSTVPNNGFNGALGSRSFVGVINNKVYHWDPYTQTFYSFDGTTWATISGGIPNSGFNGAVGSRSLVGVFNNKAYHWDPYAQVFYSFDGTTWATIAGGIPNSGFNGAISSRSYVGVINNKAYHYDPYGQLFYSFDGVSWTIENSTVPNFNGSLGAGRSYVGELENKVYHYNSYTSTLYSFDGTVWEALNSNTPSSIGGWLTDMGSTSFVGIAW
jgi:hypothetical protein